MIRPNNLRRVDEAGRLIDETMRRTQRREFEVKTPPEAAICKECNLRVLCHTEGIVDRTEVLA